MGLTVFLLWCLPFLFLYCISHWFSGGLKHRANHPQYIVSPKKRSKVNMGYGCWSDSPVETYKVTPIRRTLTDHLLKVLHQKSVDLHSSPAMLLSPMSHLKLNKPKASRVESQHKGREVQQSKAQGFFGTPWVPFHQELLKIFSPCHSFHYLYDFFLKWIAGWLGIAIYSLQNEAI